MDVEGRTCFTGSTEMVDAGRDVDGVDGLATGADSVCEDRLRRRVRPVLRPKATRLRWAGEGDQAIA